MLRNQITKLISKRKRKRKSGRVAKDFFFFFFFLFLFFGFQCPSCELLLVLLMAEVFVPILIPNFTPIYISFSLSFTFFDYSKRSLSFRKWNFVTTWNMTTVTARYANLNRELSTLFLLKKEKEKINFILV